MLHHVEGELILLGPTRAVVETVGMGIECRIPLSTYTAMKGKERSRVRLLTHLQVLEDDLRLYGFATEKERDLFRLVTSISGVGPAIALAALASFDPAGFAGAVAAGDSRALRRIKGVGPKLSERMVLELKDRAADLSSLAGGAGGAARAAVPEAVFADAVSALVELGFSRREAVGKVEAAVERLSRGQAEGGEAARREARLTVEAIIQAAMRTRE